MVIDNLAWLGYITYVLLLGYIVYACTAFIVNLAHYTFILYI